MAYNKPKNGIVNRNPWSRASQTVPRRAPRTPKPNIRSRGSMLNTSSILTGRTPSPNNKKMNNLFEMGNSSKAISKPQNPVSPNRENRGGARRMPFLSNTGPGKKVGY